MRTLAPILGCAAALLAAGLVAWHAQWIDSFALFLPAVAAQCVAYAVLAWLLMQAPPAGDSQRLLMIVFGVAALLRAIAVATPPNFLSTDLYRYIWDGRVQAAGINPYLYVPADAALERLRDPDIYPHINHIESAPTIYAPFAQMAFLAITRVLGESIGAMRFGMLAFEAVAVVALGLLLRRLGQPSHRLALYLWHPLPVWEFACGAHVDAAMTAMAMLALLAATAGRRALSGALLAMAVLTKFFPLAIAPALWRRRDWTMPAAFVAVAALLYAPYLGAGWKVLGYLGGYVAEEGVARDSLFGVVLLRAAGLPAGASVIVYVAVALAALAALALRALASNEEASAVPALAAGLATAAIAFVSPHYPWYFAWLVPFVCIRPCASLIWLTCAAFALYMTDWPLTVAQGLFIYGPFVLLLLAEQRRFILPRLREGAT